MGRPEVGLARPGQGTQRAWAEAYPHRHFGNVCPGRQRQLLAQSRKGIHRNQGQSHSSLPSLQPGLGQQAFFLRMWLVEASPNPPSL